MDRLYQITEHKLYSVFADIYGLVSFALVSSNGILYYTGRDTYLPIGVVGLLALVQWVLVCLPFVAGLDIPKEGEVLQNSPEQALGGDSRSPETTSEATSS